MFSDDLLLYPSVCLTSVSLSQPLAFHFCLTLSTSCFPLLSVSLSQPRAFPFSLSHFCLFHNLLLSTSVSLSTSCFPLLSVSFLCLTLSTSCFPLLSVSLLSVSLSQPLAFYFCLSHFCLTLSTSCFPLLSVSLLSHSLNLLLFTSVCLSVSASCFPLLSVSLMSVSLSQPLAFPFCLSHFCLSRCLNLLISPSVCLTSVCLAVSTSWFPLLSVSLLSVSLSQPCAFHFQGEQPDDEEVFALLASLKRIYAFYRSGPGVYVFIIIFQVCDTVGIDQSTYHKLHSQVGQISGDYLKKNLSALTSLIMQLLGCVCCAFWWTEWSGPLCCGSVGGLIRF